jgi:hypothetical protein
MNRSLRSCHWNRRYWVVGPCKLRIFSEWTIFVMENSVFTEIRAKAEETIEHDAYNTS